ncbi:MAG TPA: sugar ABC transporter permease [Microbacterium sp.]|nr:sugar ABC transporter permease [Microbacterium sp.]
MQSQAMRQRRWTAALLAAPLLIFAVCFVAYPLATGALTAFQDKTVYSPEETFSGLKNFGALFRDGDFVQAVVFTVLYTVVVVAVEVVLGFGLALLMHRVMPGKKLWFTLILLPIMIAPAMLGVMFRLLLNGDIGAVPAILEHLGVSVSLFSPGSVIPLLIVLDILQWTPFTFLIIYAGLQSFPLELSEAAAVDGAGYWRTLRSVVLPVIAPVFIAAMFLRMIDALRTFDVIYVLTAGGPGGMTTTVSIYIYKTAFVSGDFGKAAAAALVMLVCVLPLVPVIVKRITQSGGRNA